MANIEIHAGDFTKGKGIITGGSFCLKTPEKTILGETILFSQLETVDIATEENVKKMAGTVGWGAAGAVLLGPVGLLAGALLGGKKKQVTFIAKFKDGRKLFATTDGKSFTKMQAAIF